MKFLLRAVYLPLAICCILAISRGATPGTGSISGEVINKVTKQSLLSVRVTLLETGATTLTDRTGSYTFTGLGAGSYTVAAEYPGLDPQQTTVEVGSGRVQHDVQLTSGVYVLPAYTVAGSREGQAAATLQQQLSANIENVMTADAFGSIAKQNIGNFLQYIPGVMAISGAGDAEPPELA